MTRTLGQGNPRFDGAARKAAADAQKARHGDSALGGSSDSATETQMHGGTQPANAQGNTVTPSGPNGESSSKPGAGSASTGDAEQGVLSFQFGSNRSPSNPPAGPPISDARGNNWALPGISQGSFPFARPIRVEMTSSELVLVPTDTRQRPTRVGFDGDTRAAIEQFVSAIWQYMETWGTAGRGMYWKPVLNIYSEKEAASRASELEYLLRGSGLEIRRMNQ